MDRNSSRMLEIGKTLNAQKKVHNGCGQDID